MIPRYVPRHRADPPHSDDVDEHVLTLLETLEADWVRVYPAEQSLVDRADEGGQA